MSRFFQIFMVVVTVGVSVVVYALKYDTGRNAVAIAELKQKIAEEEDAISVLKAEWSMLSRPDRLQELAEKYLELAPLTPTHLASLNEIELKPAEMQMDALVMQALGGTDEMNLLETELAAGPVFAPAPLRKPIR